jgi:hypothetical protein
VRRKDGVDERRLSQPSLACRPSENYPNTKEKSWPRTDDDDIKLETTLQELVLDLLGNRVETDVGLSADFLSHRCSGTVRVRGEGVEREILSSGHVEVI